MEELLLDSASLPATITYAGDTSGVLTAGKTLKVETAPTGSELLNVQVPVGKVWQVRVYVSIVETPA